MTTFIAKATLAVLPSWKFNFHAICLEAVEIEVSTNWLPLAPVISSKFLPPHLCLIGKFTVSDLRRVSCFFRSIGQQSVIFIESHDTEAISLCLQSEIFL
jgi:ethanolamine utilization protein EutP (predicted NTPase)